MSTPPSPPPSLALECRGITHGFGPKKVLHNVNLRLRRGQFLSLVGPSGCGKSTLLRAIVGTHLPQQGQVRVFCLQTPHTPANEGELVTGPGRDRGIVYQHYSLFPFLTARDNVALGLQLDQTGIAFRLCQPWAWRRLRREHRQQAEAMLARVKLSDAMQLYPHEMSGGMRQRVALAQAMIMQPQIILLDEPFGALDEATREELQSMLLDLYAENQKAIAAHQPPPHTLIIVTHELNEALYVGDRIVGLSQYWNWAAAGHTQAPGATIIYDKNAPVFEVKAGRDFERFAAQRDEIRRHVFEPGFDRDPHAHVTYWSGTGPASAVPYS